MSFKEAFITNEGANLCYWTQGRGPLLILIPGGGGTGTIFNEALPNLSKNYTAATYDRRQSSKSTADTPRQLNPAQQVRDIIATMKALGFEKTSIMGHSGGCIIALQMASTTQKY
jgi:pimeloyl-ACP methyl ester carboxylesterase